MSNNLAKNGFFPRAMQPDLILDKISIKQRILRCLQETISVYRNKNCNVPDIDKISNSLSDKVILLNDKNYPSLVYSSAIAFPLANIHNLSSLQVARELVDLLEINFQKSALEHKFHCKIKVIKKGLIEFEVGDRSVGLWLERVLARSEDREIRRWGNREMGKYNFFPLQYVHNRCCSLLLLGEREGLITLQNSDLSLKTWKINDSNFFQYYCDQHIDYRYEQTEINLLRQLSLIIDYLSDSFPRNQPLETELEVWLQLLFNLALACLEFIAACRIFGSVAQQKRDLAIARLGLISIVQSFLSLMIQKTNNAKIKVDT